MTAIQRPAADPLAGLLRPARPTSVVDVGASPIEGPPPYAPMLAAGLCRVIGFEPQLNALALLEENKGPLETYLPFVIGDGDEHTLFVCSELGMTSLLRPLPRALDRFAGFSRWGSVIREERVQTRRLDDIAEVGPLDLLKIDAQGSELAVFRGGRSRLARAVAVHTEVSFVPLYENQPSFGEIDLELRALGFVPHAFADLKRWMIAPLAADSAYAHINQLLEADLVYVRDFTKMDAMDEEQLVHLALIAHHCYSSFDLATACLTELADRKLVPADVPLRYIAAISTTTARV